MKKLYFLLIALTITTFSFAQTTFFSYSFEDNGNGTIYNTSVPEFSDGSYDFFTSTFNNTIGGGYGVNGQDGTHFFAAQDLDGEGGPIMTTLTMDIDITGRSNLGLKILVAEDDFGDPGWDASDYVHIDYSIDGGSTQNFLWFESEGGSNSETRVDTDFDGTGDGSTIPETFQDFQGALTGTGTTLTLTITFNLNSGSEDIALDNIRVIENFAATPNIVVSSGVSGLDYEVGSGPSTNGTFTVEGTDLTDDITVTAPASFEISENSGGPFGSSVTLTESGGTVATTTVYVRLKESLTVGDYSEDVTVSSPGASSKTISLLGSVFNPITNALVISGVYDAGNTNHAPKGVELYVLQNIPDMSIFGIGSANNGDGTDGEEFTFPAGSANQGDRIFIASESPHFTTFFGFAPDHVSSAMGINGDDAIELFENGQVIDTFGDINTDGSGEPWEYLDGWAARNSTTGPDGTTFNIANWTFSGVGALDGTSGNASSTSPYPANQYNLSTGKEKIKGFDLYPNPTSKSFVNIESKSNAAMNIKVYDILGKQVIQQRITNNRLDVTNLNVGVYIMRVEQENAFATRKLVIR